MRNEVSGIWFQLGVAFVIACCVSVAGYVCTTSLPDVM